MRMYQKSLSQPMVELDNSTYSLYTEADKDRKVKRERSKCHESN